MSETPIIQPEKDPKPEWVKSFYSNPEQFVDKVIRNVAPGFPSSPEISGEANHIHYLEDRSMREQEGDQEFSQLLDQAISSWIDSHWGIDFKYAQNSARSASVYWCRIFNLVRMIKGKLPNALATLEKRRSEATQFLGPISYAKQTPHHESNAEGLYNWIFE